MMMRVIKIHTWAERSADRHAEDLRARDRAITRLTYACVALAGVAVALGILFYQTAY